MLAPFFTELGLVAGAAIFPGAGTVIGGIIGGALGYTVGSTIMELLLKLMLKA
jgi:hypothetical protein